MSQNPDLDTALADLAAAQAAVEAAQHADGDAETPQADPATPSGTGDPNAPKAENPAPVLAEPLAEGTFEVNAEGVPVPHLTTPTPSDTAENPHLPAQQETAQVDTPSPVVPEKSDRDMLTELYASNQVLIGHLKTIEENIQPALAAIASSPLGAMLGLKK